MSQRLSRCRGVESTEAQQYEAPTPLCSDFSPHQLGVMDMFYLLPYSLVSPVLTSICRDIYQSSVDSRLTPVLLSVIYFRRFLLP